jgi:hypothetical protein
MADAGRAELLLERDREQAHRNGSLFSQLSISLWDGAFKLAQGELAEAEGSLTNNLSETELYGIRVPQAVAYTNGFLGGARLEAGDLAGARQAVEGVTVADGDTADGTTSYAARSWASTWPRRAARRPWRRPRTTSGTRSARGTPRGRRGAR